MKIRIVAYWHERGFEKKIGGLIRFFEMADNLFHAGYNVKLYLPNIGFPRLQTKVKVFQIEIIDIPIIRPIIFQSMLFISLISNNLQKGDILYYRKMNSIVPAIVGKIFKQIVLYEIPNDPFIEYENAKFIRRIFLKLMDYISMRFANKVILLSNFSAFRIATNTNIGREKLRVLASGTNTEKYIPLDRRKCCKYLHLEENCINICFVGTFYRIQGIDVLLKAATIIKNTTSKNFRIFLIGDGPYIENIKKMVIKQHLQEITIFTGRVNYNIVPIYINAMDICVAPHLKSSNQSSPVKIFDYMACGKTVVASNIDVVREISIDKKNIFLFDANDESSLAQTIISLLDNERLRNEIGKNARKHVLKYYDRFISTIKFFELLQRNTEEP